MYTGLDNGYLQAHDETERLICESTDDYEAITF